MSKYCLTPLCFPKDVPLKSYIIVVVWDDTEIEYEVVSGELLIHVKTPISKSQGEAWKRADFDSRGVLLRYSGYTNLELYGIEAFVERNLKSIIEAANENLQQ